MRVLYRIVNFFTRCCASIWWIFPIAATCSIFLLFYFGYIPLQGKDLGERGQFGDSFGVLNSLFTGLGFGGVVVTLILQQKQIRNQEAEIKIQRDGEQVKQYEETLHLLLAMYSRTLADVSNFKGDLRGRSLLRGSTDRVLEAIKKEKVHLVPIKMQERYRDNLLTQEDKEFLDYLYFRNFTILSVEIDRQGRLIETFKVLLHHLITRSPAHLDVKPYCDMVCAQVTHVELSYFLLVALAFNNESDFRDLLRKSGLKDKAANIHRLRIHDYMYEQFWGWDIRSSKKPQFLPIDEKRIDASIRAYRVKTGSKGKIASRIYSSPRAFQKKRRENRIAEIVYGNVNSSGLS